MWNALLLSLGILPPIRGLPDYDRYELFELVLCADSVVTGEIQHVGSSTFVLRVEETIVGAVIPEKLEVERFENWTCAGRWTEYRTGQRVLLFLGAPQAGSSERSILGGGGEGEMPLEGTDVIVRGYDVHGFERHEHPVGPVGVNGTRVSVSEVAEAVRGFRAAFRWKLVEEQGLRPSAIAPLDAALADGFEESSRLARHLVEQARSSPVWGVPREAAGRLIPPARLRRIAEAPLGCIAKQRRNPECAASRFEGVNRFGALAFVGDVDGDGIGDLAAGAPWDCHAAHSAGTLWILFLARDGSVRSTTEIGEGAGGFPAQLNEFAQLGWAVAPLGDLDGDGVPDLVVGAKGLGFPDRHGAAWVLFLTREGRVKSSLELGATEALRRAGAGNGSGIGAALASLGDIDGDGQPELALGQDPDFDLGRKSGRSVWIVSLAKDGGTRWARQIRAREDGFTERHSWFGDALARVGDLDGDGTTELAIADTCDSDGGEVRGAVWIAFLRPDGSLKAKQKISDWAGGFEGGMRDSERLGRVLVGPGDLDGDGVPDLLVASSSGLWTWTMKRDGTVHSASLLFDPARAVGIKGRFADGIAWAGRGATGPALAVTGVIGTSKQAEYDSSEGKGETNKASDERDDVVWYFTIDDTGLIAPW